MEALAVKFQNPRNTGPVLAEFGLLGFFSQVALRALSQYGWSWSGEQIVQLLPVAPLCHMVVSWIPASEWLGSFCPWFSLFGAAVRVLCWAL